MDERALKRFWSKVEKTDSCWVWIAARNNKGYGVFYDPRKPNNNKMGYAHRMLYEHERGQIPYGGCCAGHSGCRETQYLALIEEVRSWKVSN